MTGLTPTRENRRILIRDASARMSVRSDTEDPELKNESGAMDSPSAERLVSQCRRDAPMQIIVQIERGLARCLHEKGLPALEQSDLARVAAQLGIVPQPLHPGSSDPSLVGFFSVDVPDQAMADRVVGRLLQTKGIEAAYIKPRDETP